MLDGKKIGRTIRECESIALRATEVLVRVGKYSLKANVKRAKDALKGLKWGVMELRDADGMTMNREHKIVFNKVGIEKWSRRYLKLVLLHELAHYFTKFVSGSNAGHGRTWFYGQHFFNLIGFGVIVASKISTYNLARYCGPMKDSNVDLIMKFANKLGINHPDQIWYDVIEIKNYCSNLLKNEQRVIKRLEGKPKDIVLTMSKMSEEERRCYMEEQTKLMAIKLGYITQNISEDASRAIYRKGKKAQEMRKEKEKVLNNKLVRKF